MEPLGFESIRCVGPDEFRDFVEQRECAGDVNRYELLHGRVVLSPPEGWPHGAVGGAIQLLLGTWNHSARRGVVMSSSQGFLLPSGDVVQPDHTFMSYERLRAAHPVDGEFLKAAPDLVIEVLSSSSAARDRGEKREIYERNGVLDYWLVDPWAKTLTAFTSSYGRYGPAAPLNEGEHYRSLLLGLEFEVSSLFPVPTA